MKTKLVISLFIFILPLISLGQEQEDSTQYYENFSSIMINASFTNNNLENITESAEKIPTLFTNLSFFHKSGFYLGGGYASYFSDSIYSYDYDVEAGYQKYFDSGFDIDISYTWHNYEGDSLFEGINYDHSFLLMMGLDIEKFYVSSSIAYKIGNTKNTFIDVGLSRFIQVDGIFAKTDALLINPTVSFSFGTDYWIYEDMTSEDKDLLFTDLKSSGYSYETLSYESFDIYVPVSYGIKNTYLTFSWLYKIPGQKYKYMGWENKSSFMISLTYFLNFTR